MYHSLAGRGAAFGSAMGLVCLAACAVLSMVVYKTGAMRSYPTAPIVSQPPLHVRPAVVCGAQSLFQPQTAQLPDGSHVDLLAMTVGAHHAFRRYHYDTRPIIFNAPDQVPQDSIVLWIQTRRNPAADPHKGIYLNRLRLYDERGQAYMACEAQAEWQNLPDQIMVFCLRTYPRRTQEIRVEFTCNDTPVRFQIPNPCPVTTPPLTAEPLPIVRRNGGLEVTLEGLHPVPPVMSWSGPMERLSALTRMQGLDTLAAFRCRYQGREDVNWSPAEAMLSDACGNRYAAREPPVFPVRFSNGVSESPLKTLKYYRADTGEPLMLQTWFYRTAEADFPPEETVRIANIDPHRQRLSQVADAKAQWKGATIQLHEIQDCECMGKRTCLTVHAMNLPPHTRLLLQAHDEQGRKAGGVVGPTPQSRWIPGSLITQDEWENGRRIHDPPYQRIEFLMDLPPGSTRLTLTFAISQGRYMEFTPVPLPIATAPPSDRSPAPQQAAPQQ